MAEWHSFNVGQPDNLGESRCTPLKMGNIELCVGFSYLSLHGLDMAKTTSSFVHLFQILNKMSQTSRRKFVMILYEIICNIT